MDKNRELKVFRTALLNLLRCRSMLQFNSTNAIFYNIKKALIYILFMHFHAFQQEGGIVIIKHAKKIRETMQNTISNIIQYYEKKEQRIFHQGVLPPH